MEKNKIISISIKESVLSEIDSLANELNLSGRSETIRAGIRALELETNERAKLSGKTDAVLIIVHDHSNAISKIAHDYSGLITSHLHNHFKDKCVETFVLSGEGKKIKSLASSLSKNKKIIKIRLIVC